MYNDSELILSGTRSGATWTGQRVCNAGATEASTDYVDTLAAGQAIAPGARIRVVSTSTFTGTATTLTVSLQTDSDSGFATDLVTLVASAAIAKASIASGTVLLDVVIPAGVKRYLRVMYTGDNTFETTGSAVASIVLDSDNPLDRGL